MIEQETQNRLAYQKRYREENRERRTAYQYSWKAKNPEKWKAAQRKAKLKRDFGITLEEYERMILAQGRKCRICQISQEEVKTNFAVDHNHETGQVRGLLCRDCNMGLGKFKDNPDLLMAAIKHLTSVV